MMIKVGPATTGNDGGSVWDEKGRCQMAKIFISHGDYFISSLQFMYFENDGRFVLSDLYGAGHNGHFSIVVLDYPSEYLTWISGTYYGNGLRSITFGTNKGSHGPYGSSVPHPSLAYKEFHFQIGDDVDSFGGFHGIKQYNRIEGIGVYVNTITSKDSALNAKKSQVDDEHVTKEDAERALEETRQRKEKEEKEQKRKEEAEAHLYKAIKLARDEDLVEQVGKEIYFDLVDHNKVHSFHTQKQITFNQFKEEVAREFGIPVQFQRFWLWSKRQNHTYRPYRPLTAQEEIQSVGQVREVHKANDAELNLYLECLDLQTFPPPEKTKEDILLFFKLYDPLKEEIRYVGRLYVKGSSNPVEILTKLNGLAGFSPNEEIELFEEIKVEPNVMCERINMKRSFYDNQLDNGDIICFQKSLQNQGSEKCRFPEVPSFLEYIHNRHVVRFRSLEKPNEDDFSLGLSKHNNYDEVVECVARYLDLNDPSKVRLTSHNCFCVQPKSQPIQYRGVSRLTEMLSHVNLSSDILYYEVLDIPLPELQGLNFLNIAFCHAAKDKVTIHTIKLPKESTVGDVLNDLKTKVELSRPDAELRLLEIFHHRIYKILPLNARIEKINEHWTLRAEEIPEEEKNLGPRNHLIQLIHFMKKTTQDQTHIQNFGDPFFLVIHEGETLTKVKARIQRKLQVPNEEFLKWRFTFFPVDRCRHLQDSDIVSNHFQKRSVYRDWEICLGLEHTANSPKGLEAANTLL